MCKAQIREQARAGDYSEGYVAHTVAKSRTSMTREGWTFVPSPVEAEQDAHWVCTDCFNRYRDRFNWLERSNHS